MTPRPMPVILTAAEVAKALHISVARTYALARLGLLPSVKLGRSIRFLADAIIEFLERGGAGIR